MAKMLCSIAAIMEGCGCCAILNPKNSKDEKRSRRIVRAREKRELDFYMKAVYDG